MNPSINIDGKTLEHRTITLEHRTLTLEHRPITLEQQNPNPRT